MFQSNLSHKLFLVYLTLLLIVFSWASVSGTRLLGDEKEEFSPGVSTRPGSTGTTGYHYFHHK